MSEISTSELYNLIYNVCANKISNATFYYDSDTRDPNILPQAVISFVNDADSSLSKKYRNGNIMFYCNVFTKKGQLGTALSIAESVKHIMQNLGDSNGQKIETLNNASINNVGLDTSTPIAMHHLAVTVTFTNILREV